MKAGLSQLQWDETGIAIIKSSTVGNANYFLKPETGVEIGGTAFQRFSKRFTLNEEINVLVRTSVLDDVPTVGQKNRLNNLYVFIPFFISYNFYKPLSLDFGGNFGGLIQSNDKTYQKTMPSLDLSGVLLGLRYKISPKLNIQGRFAQSWENIAPYLNNKEAFDNMGRDLNIPKRISKTFSLSVGYNF